MSIYELNPIDSKSEPWGEEPFEKSFGFIVRAGSKREARRFAAVRADSETSNSWLD